MRLVLKYPGLKHPGLILLLALCSYFVLSFTFLVFSNFFPGPYNDYWVDIWNVEKAWQGLLSFNDLINAHNNAHRIFIPRLIFILDYYFFNGTNLLIVVVCLLCKALTLWVLNQPLQGQPIAARITLNAVLIAALLNADNVYNIIYSSNVQWDLMILFSVLAIASYSKGQSLLAWCWFICGFLSQAGALPVVLAFMFVDIINRHWRQLTLNLLFTAIVFYLNFSVFPVSNPENPTFESAAWMIITAPLVVLNFVIHLMASGVHWYIKTPSYYFSLYLLLLLVASVLLARRTFNLHRNVFLHIAVCAFLMIVIIAAGRSMFGPGQWAASRFHVVPLLFIPCLTLHAFLSAPLFLQARKLLIARSLLTAHALILLLMVHFYTYRDPIDFSNKVFDTHSYMFTHERDQFFGSGLRIHLWENDPFVHIDPFFRQYGYAYYANKQSASHAFTPVGTTRLQPDELASFAQGCVDNTGAINFGRHPETGEFEFQMPLNPKENNFFKAALFRNSWYVLDAQGVVTGFAFLFIEEQRFFTRASLKGYSSIQDIHFLADVHNDRVRCRYRLRPLPTTAE